MSSKNTAMSQPKKIVMFLMTAALWLATVGLGALAFIQLQGVMIFIGVLFLSRDPELGAVAARGWVTIIRNISTFIGGLVWLGVVVGGMEYHFSKVGERRSLRIFIWTIVIEVIIIVAGFIFTPGS